MSSPASRPVGGAPAAQPVFPDEILEEIFVRLDAVADIARTSAACTTFRRVVSARSFRRRFRSLHPRPVLGFLEFDAPGAFHPAEPPHGSAPAARALAQAVDFTFSFLDTPNCWWVCDSRDGRVLLYRRLSMDATFADLVVCDPLHRRYAQLPPIPDELAAATGRWDYQEFDPFLDPATDKEREEEDLSFRVICVVQCQRKLVTFHFSSVTGNWRVITFNRPTPLDPFMVEHCGLFERHYAHSCFYWTFRGRGSLFVLDTREMKFSVVNQLSSNDDLEAHAIVEIGEDRLGIAMLDDGFLKLYSKALGNKNNSVDTEDWQLEKRIPLPQVQVYCKWVWSIPRATEGYLLLRAIPRSHILYNTPESHYFTLDLKTLLVDKLCVLNQDMRGAHLYVSFPPLLSPPSI
jgi:hypothetical protein